jgi:tetratricopeptide (TPR) repeat protein
MPWLSAREVERAVDVWRTRPDDARADLERARKLNPLSARPDLVAGAIAMRQEDYGRAEEAFERALERNGEDWYAELELAIVAALEGRRDDALARLDRAEELNPGEEAIPLVAAPKSAGAKYCGTGGNCCGLRQRTVLVRARAACSTSMFTDRPDRGYASRLALRSTPPEQRRSVREGGRGKGKW